ncbi:MAG TPA: hypothetical protein VFE16_09755 [Candidatus Cybelea sp.]|nr:hypothetical protein [Candidatus Cybelea sp.]
MKQWFAGIVLGGAVIAGAATTLAAGAQTVMTPSPMVSPMVSPSPTPASTMRP